MSKFRRKSQKSVNMAVYHKINVYVPIMNRILTEELEVSRQVHLKRISELYDRYENLEIKRKKHLISQLSSYRDIANDSFVSQKYLAISSTLITLAVILIIGVISNAP